MQTAFKILPSLLLVIGILVTSPSRGQSPQPPIPNPVPPQPGPQPPQPIPPAPQPNPRPPNPQPPAPQPETEPVITEQPQSQQVKLPARATFSVKATGNPAPTYQWSVNGTPINGAKGSSYSTGATTLANDGDTYTVTVSNGVGNPVTSDPAILSVTPS